MKTGKMREPVSKEEAIKRKQETLDNIDKTVIDSGKKLLNLMKSIVGVDEAEGATTSQDVDFDPTAKGPRGFTGPDSKPLAVKSEKAKGATGIYPEYGEQYTGGTSEESDIEGFTGEDVDMPPIVMDEIVVSEKAKPSVLSGLPKETQEDIRRQLANKEVTHLKSSPQISVKLKKIEVNKIKQEIKQATKTLPKSSKNSQQIAKATMGVTMPQSVETLTNVIQGYLTSDAPTSHMIEYGGRATLYAIEDKLGLLSSERKQNLTQLENFVTKNAKAAFSQELGKISKHIGLGVDDLKDHMRFIYMAETNVGTNVKDSIPTKSGDRSAIGELQVMATTFKDLIGKQFGKNAATQVGLDYKELLKLKKANNKDALEDLLRIKNVNFMAGMAKMIQYLEVKSKGK